MVTVTIIGSNMIRPVLTSNIDSCSACHNVYRIGVLSANCTATSLGHTNLILCYLGRNGLQLQMRLVGRFKNKNDSHVTSISCRSSPNKRRNIPSYTG